MKKIISIGSIPEDSKTEIIYCGDSETSKTVELNFKIENQTTKVRYLILNFQLITRRNSL